MIVDLTELRLKGEPLELDLELSDEALNVSSPLASLVENVNSHVRVSLRGEVVRINGWLETYLSITCCRCASSFDQEVEKVFALEYWPDPEPQSEYDELELSYNDLDIGFYRDDVVDLSAVISEQVVLEVPMKPVCREDCKGLCARCGADLNRGDCGCDRTVVDPRLAVLADLKKRSN